MYTVLKQNNVLEGASLVFRTCFESKRGRNTILSVGVESYKQLAGIRHLNVAWCQGDFLPNRPPWALVRYKCWRYGHTRLVCRSVSLCGRCGALHHQISECTSEPLCPNCNFRNRRRLADKKVPTNHAAGSKEFHIYMLEFERLSKDEHGE